MSVVEDWLPDTTAIRGLPNAATRRAEVIDRRLTRDSRDGCDATRAMRSDQPPLHGRERFRIVLSECSGRCQNYERKNCEKKIRFSRSIHVQASDDRAQFIIVSIRVVAQP